MSPPTSQNLAEFDELLTIYALMQPQRVLEIGTHEGGTLFYWLKYAPRGALVGSIDLQGRITHAQANEWCAEDVTPLLFKGNSVTDEAVTWATDNLGKIDWLFIDGGHDYYTVLSDWNNYVQLVNPGGVVAFHDILPHPPYEDQLIEVDRLWETIKNSEHNTQEIIEDHEEWGRGPGIGVVYL